MKHKHFVLRTPVLLSLILAFVITNAQAGPDCGIVSLKIEEIDYSPTHTIYIRCFIKNYGDVRQAGAEVVFYLSEDTTITSDDIRITSKSDICPSPDRTASHRIPKTFQEGSFPAGEYYVGAIVSCPGDTNPDNDTLCTNTCVSYDGSDLTVESMQFSGFSTSEWGGEVWVDYCVKNVGLRESWHYFVTFYASKDTSISTNDHRIVGKSGAGLSPKQVGCQRTKLELKGLLSGDYYVGAIVSCLTDFHGTASKVLCSSDTFSIDPAPDLSVKHIRAESGSFQPGDTISIYDAVVENKGYGISERYTIDFYATADKNVEPTDYHMGSKSYSPLDVGKQKNFARSLEFPDDMPNDDYYIGVIVTCPDDFDLENNQGVSSRSVWVGSSPDLSVQSVQIDAGSYRPDDELVIGCLIQNIGTRTSHAFTIDYYASANTFITEDDHWIGQVDRSSLVAGGEDHCETTVRVPYSIAAGDYYMGAIVTVHEEYDRSNNAGCSDSTVELVHPSGYLCGHTQYEYRSAQNSMNSDKIFPIRYALVQVFEEDTNNDPLDDRLIVETHTDPNGNYGIVLSNEEGGPDNVYIKIVTEGVSGAYPGTDSKICAVRDCVFEEVYSLVSSPHAHPREGSAVINMTSPDHGEFLVYDSIVEGFIQASLLAFVEPNEPNEVMVYWPGEEDFSYFDPCDQGIYIAQDDRRDRDVIMHEYGHYVAQICGVGLGPVGDNPVHFWDQDLRKEPVWRNNDEAMNLAFREAWATVFSIATQYGDSHYPYSGDSQYQDEDENANWSFIVELDCKRNYSHLEGQFYEHMNAGAMWDVFATIDNNGGADDDLSVAPSFSMIWGVSRDHKPDDIIGFWDSWFLDYDYEQELTSIFEAHGMPFVKPGQ